jgi:hypothetical protein
VAFSCMSLVWSDMCVTLKLHQMEFKTMRMYFILFNGKSFKFFGLCPYTSRMSVIIYMCSLPVVFHLRTVKRISVTFVTRTVEEIFWTNFILLHGIPIRPYFTWTLIFLYFL